MSRDFRGESVAIIGPESNLQSACKDRVAWALATLPRFGLEASPPSDAALRAEIKDFASSLRRARLKFDALSPWSKAVLFTAGDEALPGPAIEPDLFVAVSDRVRAMSKALIDEKGIPSGKRGPKLDPLTLAAAEIAFGLLAEFSPRPPSTTTDGPHHRLAQILVEAVSGRAEVPVESACDLVAGRIDRKIARMRP